MSEVIKSRYRFVVLFQVENGDSNENPDAGNISKIDAERWYAIVTDACLKSKIRNYIKIIKGDSKG
ncbi:type I CRISPR-associated protein Cas7 [Clostridium tagluense]|uniref:type I CRISPR-associated protein Cas7 n=1 Tax=Clostridium tagluense TaxID=360422 RepID=UPI001CF389DC|nr:type I CRISPR-associated protein Cas7 [Clostridium tagluense]